MHPSERRLSEKDKVHASRYGIKPYAVLSFRRDSSVADWQFHMSQFRVGKICSARRRGPVWVCKVEDEEGTEIGPVTLPCLASWVTYTLDDDGAVVGAVGGVPDLEEVARLVGSAPYRVDADGARVPLEPEEWPNQDWTQWSGAVEAVCRNSWLDGDALMALLTPKSPKWRRTCVSEGDSSGMRHWSARKGVTLDGFSTIGEWTYYSHWHFQVERVASLVHPDSIIRRGEPIYKVGMENLDDLIYVTPCPVIHADLEECGIPSTLIHPLFPHPQSSPEVHMVIVGLEDTTLLNLIHLLEWVGDRPVEVWHRWEPRVNVPWRGFLSPPMALEIMDTIVQRAEPGELLGEGKQMSRPSDWPGGFWETHTAIGVPGFQLVRKRVSQKEVKVNDVVYVESAGVHAIVTKVETSDGCTTKKPVNLGLFCESGPSTLHLRCGNLGYGSHQFTVASDSSFVYAASKQPAAHLPRMGDRLALR